VATVIANVIHEGIGHGGMCVATGGHPLALSTVHFECSLDTRLVAAGGTLANLVFGALFLGRGARAVRQRAAVAILLLASDDFQSARRGRVFSVLRDRQLRRLGQRWWRGWQPAWAWRVGLIALGVVTYFFWFVPLCLRELRPFLRSDAQIRVRRGAATHARELFHPPESSHALRAHRTRWGPLLILVSAAASSFGGHSGLAWMWTLLLGPAHSQQRIADA